MANFDRIIAHRGTIVTALTVYAKLLDKIKKLEGEGEVSTDDTDDRIATVEMLKAEFVDQRALILEGTPMGDQITEKRYTADDGTVLTADNLDAMLTGVGVNAPFEAITGWTLEQRVAVHAYVRERQGWLLNGKGDAHEPPECILLEWVTGADAVLEMEMPDSEIDEWIVRGPWYLAAQDPKNPASSDWEVRKQDPNDAALYIPHGVFGQLDRARLIAANLNAIEKGKQMQQEFASLPDLTVREGISAGEAIITTTAPAANEAADAVEKGAKKKRAAKGGKKGKPDIEPAPETLAEIGEPAHA